MTLRDKRSFTNKQKKIIMGIGIFLFAALCLLVAWFAGRPLLRFAGEPDKFRAWVDERGLWAHIVFVGMIILQVIVAVIPGEPLEIAAGYAFGSLEGTILCVIGTLVGSVAVFLAVRKLGQRLAEVFFSLEKLKSVKFLQNEKRLTFWVFVIFFLPGTPKDLLCYFVGLTDLPLANWVFITALARLPSIVTSTVGGNALGEEDYLTALAVFLATTAVSLLGVLIYRGICRVRDNRKDD